MRRLEDISGGPYLRRVYRDVYLLRKFHLPINNLPRITRKEARKRRTVHEAHEHHHQLLTICHVRSRLCGGSNIGCRTKSGRPRRIELRRWIVAANGRRCVVDYEFANQDAERSDAETPYRCSATARSASRRSRPSVGRIPRLSFALTNKSETTRTCS